MLRLEILSQSCAGLVLILRNSRLGRSCWVPVEQILLHTEEPLFVGCRSLSDSSNRCFSLLVSWGNFELYTRGRCRRGVILNRASRMLKRRHVTIIGVLLGIVSLEHRFENLLVCQLVRQGPFYVESHIGVAGVNHR
jgi:hypothetical protein